MNIEEIFYTYRDKVFGFFVKNLSDQELAKDLTQEAFYRLCKRKDQLEDIQNLNNYIFLMCRNLVINHINKASYEIKYRDHLIREWHNLSIRGKSDIEKNINSDYLKEILEKSLTQLPPRQKQIFTLSKQQGWSNDQIALKLGISPNTVKNHLHQAMKTLRSTIDPDIDFILLLLILSTGWMG